MTTKTEQNDAGGKPPADEQSFADFEKKAVALLGGESKIEDEDDNPKGGDQNLEGEQDTADETPAEGEEEAEDDAQEGDGDDAGDDGQSDTQSDADGDDGAPDGKKKRRKSAAKRINELTAQRAAEERRANDLQARLDAIEAARNTPTPSPAPAPNTEPRENDGRPDPSKYKYGELDAQYNDDLIEWRVEQTVAKREKAREAEQRALTVKQKVSKFVEAGSEKYEDFVDKVVVAGQKGTFRLPDNVVDLAVDSDNGYDVMYYLASTPAEARRFNGLSPMRQAALFGQIEARLSQPSSNEGNSEDTNKKPPAATPPPGKRTRGTAAPTKIPSTTTDFAKFEALAERIISNGR